MKALKIILIIIGSLLVLISFWGFFGHSRAHDYPDGANKTAYEVGYYGSVILLNAIGPMLLYWAYRINRKIKKKKESEMIDAFLK